MKISVIMATYNGEKYLDSQIESVLSQTQSPDEIIVCDDCSTDATISILSKYEQLGKLKYYQNAKNVGVIENFKRGVSLATVGNYISLCDQDDKWMPDKLEKAAALMKTIDEPEIPCMVYSDLFYMDQDENVLNPSFWNEVGKQEEYEHNLHTLLFSQFVNGCTTLINPKMRDMFQTIPNKVRFHHDDWMALQAFALGRVSSLKEPTVKYRKHGNNVTIKADTKPRNRYRTLANQLYKVFTGRDDFLSIRFELAKLFYERYSTEMNDPTRQFFEYFISLQKKTYIEKKFAFRKTIKKYTFPVSN